MTDSVTMALSYSFVIMAVSYSSITMTASIIMTVSVIMAVSLIMAVSYFQVKRWSTGTMSQLLSFYPQVLLLGLLYTVMFHTVVVSL